MQRNVCVAIATDKLWLYMVQNLNSIAQNRSSMVMLVFVNMAMKILGNSWFLLYI